MNSLKTECKEIYAIEHERNQADQRTNCKKVCVLTNGCPENRIDCSKMQKFAGDNGCTITSEIKEADIIVFNACGLTESTQEHSIDIIKFIETQKKPSAELVVCGCLPRINKSRLREVYHGFAFEHDIGQLKEVIDIRTDPEDAYANCLIPRAYVPSVHRWTFADLKKLASLMSIKERLTKPYYDHLDQAVNVFHSHSFCIKVSSGCPNRCAFCAVKVSRGELKSKPIEKIVEEFKEGLVKGYKEFSLLGTDVGAYGMDLGITLVDLLRELLQVEGDYTIRLRNIQPKFLIKMMPELRDILRSGKITYLSTAAESGNNQILGLMRRGYKIEDYKEAVLSLKREFPKLQIRTQIMVGFPGETEEEFEDSLRLLDEIEYDFVEVYQFQPRPGTEAAKMKDQVPAKISRRRYHKAYMKALSNLKRKKAQSTGC
jgi:threonylcarbamoyladenosine tRNA methylthiotransferase CDKAL1